MMEKMNRCYPVWLNLVPLLIAFFSLLYVLATYEQLPARVATHFNFWGLPDGYGSRQSILLLPVIGLIIAVGTTLVNMFAIMRPDDPKKIFNMDPNRLQALGAARLEQMRIFMARCLFVITLLASVMLSYGSWGSVRVALGLQQGLGMGMMVLASALIVVSIYMTVRSLQWTLASPAKKDR